MSLRVVCPAAIRGHLKNFLTVGTHRPTFQNLASKRDALSIRRLLSTSRTSASDNISKASSSKFGPKDKYVTIYKFPEIQYIRLVNRTKRLLSVLLPVIGPVSVTAWLWGYVPGDIVACLCVSGLIIYLNFYGLSYLSKNAVGFIYASPDLSHVQIAYVDNTGKRKDDIVPVSDIVPQSEMPPPRMGKYSVKVIRYSNPPSGAYKLNLSHGEITDLDRFNHIFGKMEW